MDKINQPRKPTTDEEAIAHFNEMFTGKYIPVAQCQYKLSRQRGRSVTDSVWDAYYHILHLTSRVIEEYKLSQIRPGQNATAEVE